MEMIVNDIYYYALEIDARVIILYGGADSGKSFFVGAQYIPLALMYEPYIKAMCVRKTERDIADSCFVEIEDGIDLMCEELSKDNPDKPVISTDLFHFTRSRGNLGITSKENGNHVMFRGLDKVSKLKSIKGLNLIWLEEGEEIFEHEFDNLLLRLRGGGYERIIMTYNPVDEDHFTNTRFIKGEKHEILERHDPDPDDEEELAQFPEGRPKVWTQLVSGEVEDEDGNMVKVEYKVLVINSIYKDNDFVSLQRRLALESLKETNPKLYEALTKGKYASYGEKIFTNWEVADLSELIPTFDNIRYGLDWGFYPDPFRFLSTHIDHKRRTIYIFDEVNLYDATNNVIADKIAPKLHTPRAKIVCDSASPKDIADLKSNYSFNTVGAKKGPGSVDAGIKKLKEYKVVIHTSCTHSIKDFKLYSRKRDRHGNITNVPEDAWNHTPDILRYIMEEFMDKKPIWTV